MILTEGDAESFRAAWGLSTSVAIIGGNTTNLGRNDDVSGVTDPGNWGANNIQGWSFSQVGDSSGSWSSSLGDIGNPGVVPAPASVALASIGALMMGRRRR